jgi:integrase
MSLNTEIELKRWKPSKNDERKRCGPNLYVKGYLNGKKKFQMRFGNKPWIDIGYYPQTSLAQAREITLTAKRVHKERLASHEQMKKAAITAKTGSEFEARLNSSVVETKERSGIPTFDECYRQWYRLQFKANRWTHKSSISKPIRGYEMHLAGALGNLRIERITRNDLKQLIQKIYLAHPDLGPHLRTFIDEVMEEAVDAELIPSNPCPPHSRFTVPKTKTRHSPSLDFKKLPELWNWIEQAPFSFTAKVAMRTAIVTAHRASVIAFARWQHIDLETGRWAIPEKPEGPYHDGLMKSGRAFDMQLPSGILEQFSQVRALNEKKVGEYVFDMGGGKPIHPETLRRNFQKFGEITTHGLRNTFKTWALREDVSDFVVDRYVDHALGGLDKAYRRDDVYDERAALAERYFTFITGNT